MAGTLGRRVPEDWEHVEKYPYRSVQPLTATTTERILRLPVFHKTWDQGSEGACVGFGTSMMMSIINENQARAAKTLPYVHRYDPRWLWNEAKKIDVWADTNPGDSNGTSVRAACDVLRDQGHVRIISKKSRPVDSSQGISTNRWASTVDEVRTSISLGNPCSIGVNWYSNFDSPVKKNKESWIGEGDLGSVRGGHCVCLYGASDRRQAVRVKNSWGTAYPSVWLPYKTLERLLAEYGEITIVTDR